MIREKIDKFHLEDIKNKQHPSVVFRHENYDLFILRIPELDSEKNISFVSKPFVITEDKYYFYDSIKEEFIDLGDMQGFYKYLDKSIDGIVKITTDYLDTMESIEDIFYNGKSIKNFNQQWFEYKNTIVRINRVLFKAAEVMRSLITLYKHEDDYLERNFEDLQEHMQRAHRNSGFLLEKLDALYNFNLTQTNEQMNRIVYILTLLSGIFLPLNLIVGFFGMNTTSLPFTQTSGGTFNVIFVLCISALLATALTYFMRKHK